MPVGPPIRAVVCCVVSVAVLAAAPAASAAPCPGTIQTQVNAATDGQVIALPAGSCSITLTISNTHAFVLQGAPSGTTLTPEDATQPVISATGAMTFALTGVTFTGGSVVPAVQVSSTVNGAEGVTITHDTFTGNGQSGLEIDSGATAAASATVVSNDLFSGNTTDAFGGGAELVGAARFVVAGDTFTGNSTVGSIHGGGGLDLEDGNGLTSPVTISGNTFGGMAAGAANSTPGLGAGALVSLDHGQTLTLTGNSFIDNAITGAGVATAPRVGAGIAIVDDVTDTAFPVNQSGNVFSGNVIDETEASGSTGLAAGGAGEWAYGVNVTSTDDTFTNNRVAVNDGAPPEGGALGVLGTNQTPTPQPGTFAGANDVFMGNSTASRGWGGAIYVGGPPAYCASGCAGSSLTLADSTVAHNSVDAGAGSEGGALWGSPNDGLTIHNSIVFSNSPQAEIFGFAAPSFGFSDVCSESGGPAVTGSGNICADPQLDAGGHETQSSPTIDAGSNALVAPGLSTDAGGGPRILAGHPGCGAASAIVDMGAFEAPMGPIPPCAPSISPVTPVVSAVHQSHSVWRLGKKVAHITRKRIQVGTTFSFKLNIPARVRFAFTQSSKGRKVARKCVPVTRRNKRKHTCTRTVAVATLSFAGHAGTNKVSFQGRVSRTKKLKPGRYRLVITASNSAGKKSKPQSLSFTIAH